MYAITLTPKGSHMPLGPQDQEILELERRYWAALQNDDSATALSLTDFPCLVVGPEGIRSIDERTYARNMEQATHRLTRVEIEDDAIVRRLGDDVAVVAYRVRADYVVEGKPLTVHAADASTWIRRQGAWRCALHSEAVLEDAARRAAGR